MTIYQHTVHLKHGWKDNGKPISDVERDHIITRYFHEQAFKWQIAKELGRSLSPINRVIKEHEAGMVKNGC